MSRRPLSLAALIAALFVLGACAEGPTAPKPLCQVTQGAHDCAK